MLLVIAGRQGTFVVSRGGKRPLRLFLKRHGLKGQPRQITPKLHLAEIASPGPAAWRALRGLARTTFRHLFLHTLSESARFGLVERAPDQVERRAALQSQFLELKGVET